MLPLVESDIHVHVIIIDLFFISILSVSIIMNLLLKLFHRLLTVLVKNMLGNKDTKIITFSFSQFGLVFLTAQTRNITKATTKLRNDKHVSLMS